MSDISEERKLKPERRERKEIRNISVEYRDGSVETWSFADKPGAFLNVYPNQVTLGGKEHTHFHDFNIHWTEPR